MHNTYWLAYTAAGKGTAMRHGAFVRVMAFLGLILLLFLGTRRTRGWR